MTVALINFIATIMGAGLLVAAGVIGNKNKRNKQCVADEHYREIEGDID
jgi:hypothetical protein